MKFLQFGHLMTNERHLKAFFEGKALKIANQFEYLRRILNFQRHHTMEDDIQTSNDFQACKRLLDYIPVFGVRKISCTRKMMLSSG
eukprot:1320770-Amorphochlora_amoeboformis.AAC.1